MRKATFAELESGSKRFIAIGASRSKSLPKLCIGCGRHVIRKIRRTAAYVHLMHFLVFPGEEALIGCTSVKDRNKDILDRQTDRRQHIAVNDAQVWQWRAHHKCSLNCV